MSNCTCMVYFVGRDGVNGSPGEKGDQGDAGHQGLIGYPGMYTSVLEL